MKHIILSADGDSTVYSVPDPVAEDLRKYLDIFFDWLYDGPGKDRYFDGWGFRFDERAFIEYLNTELFPDEVSAEVENIGFINFESQVPPEYRGLPSFNF